MPDENLEEVEDEQSNVYSRPLPFLTTILISLHLHHHDPLMMSIWKHL
jgi:hypothetical protein